ncbi:GIY-YIG nuclease family protein [Rhizorhabdus dicambivorans]|uniref:GIY-YIG nuclease family protein n=1 Tax=Rhizorhabdus dicambivorans TaxID=1850238 RepID=UPI0030B81BAD
MLASGRHGTIYIGVTSDLMGRLHQHRTRATPGFTSRYDVFRLDPLWEDRALDLGFPRQS